LGAVIFELLEPLVEAVGFCDLQFLLVDSDLGRTVGDGREDVFEDRGLLLLPGFDLL
jgi:hypothetical protein